jgi:hypothetical protein
MRGQLSGARFFRRQGRKGRPSSILIRDKSRTRCAGWGQYDGASIGKREKISDPIPDRLQELGYATGCEEEIDNAEGHVHIGR